MKLFNIGTQVEVYNDGKFFRCGVIGDNNYQIRVNFDDSSYGTYSFDQLKLVENSETIKSEIEQLEIEKLKRLRNNMRDDVILSKIKQFIRILGDLTYWRPYIRYRSDGTPDWHYIDNGDKIISINKMSGGTYSNIRWSDGAIIHNDWVELYLDDAINNPSKIKRLSR
jgi:hypothetical protein